jgi:lysine 2,3-aminomutase
MEINSEDSIWQEQLRNTIKNVEGLAPYIHLTEQEIQDMGKVSETYKMSITPYYASLMDKDNPNCPIRKMVLPDIREIENPLSIPDMDKEASFEETQGLRQEFKEKCTILLTFMCPNYCRYCFRKYWVGRDNRILTYSQIDKIIESIQSNKNIEEVCLSGGDPLTLSNEYLDYVLTKIKSVEHIKVVRIFTRVPVFLPQRITSGLIKVLKKYPSLYLCTHFNHPKEITPESIKACRELVDNGIPVLNQTVLLKGVNDNSEVMRDLLWRLVSNKIKPFYLYHCIKTMGNDHLVTKVDVGQKILKDLYCHMSALAIPLYIVPLYEGKALVMPEYLEKDENGKMYFTNLRGERFYIDKLEPL